MTKLKLYDFLTTSFVERTKKDAICNVPLPPTQPLASPDAQVAQRLFIVLSAVRLICLLAVINPLLI